MGSPAVAAPSFVLILYRCVLMVPKMKYFETRKGWQKQNVTP
jgi:hypothetical protein